jgi:hypothetical protein
LGGGILHWTAACEITRSITLPLFCGAGIHQAQQFLQPSSWCRKFERLGTDVMIFKIFSLKNLAKKLAFLTQNKAKF